MHDAYAAGAMIQAVFDEAQQAAACRVMVHVMEVQFTAHAEVAAFETAQQALGVTVAKEKQLLSGQQVQLITRVGAVEEFVQHGLFVTLTLAGAGCGAARRMLDARRGFERACVRHRFPEQRDVVIRVFFVAHDRSHVHESRWSPYNSTA